MKYANGFDKGGFLEHMFEEFPSAFETPFSREMLENIVDYGMKYHNVSKNGMYYYLKDMLPEVEARDLVPFMDKEMLTEEVLGLVDSGEARVPPHVDFKQLYDCWGIYIDGHKTIDVSIAPQQLEGMNFVKLKDYIDKTVDDVAKFVDKAVGSSLWTRLMSKEDERELKDKMFNSWWDYYGIEDKKVART